MFQNFCESEAKKRWFDLIFGGSGDDKCVSVYACVWKSTEEEGIARKADGHHHA